MLRFLTAVFIAAQFFGPMAWALDLQAHRAIYALELGRARAGSGVADASGRLVVEFNNQCEGTVFTQRIVSRIQDADGGHSVTDSSTSSWEASDGLSYRFMSRQSVDGEVQDETDGSAELESKGGRGDAVFNSPKGRKVSLAKGTIFPAEFNTRVVEAALRGEQRVDLMLFDGSADVDVYHALATIGPEQAPGKVKAAGGNAGTLVNTQKSWIVAVAYYRPNEPEGLPDYEVTFRMFPNGIAGDLTIDYGDFSLHGRLTRVDRLTKPRC